MAAAEEHIHCPTLLATSPASPAPRRLLDTLASRSVAVAVVYLWHGVGTHNTDMSRYVDTVQVWTMMDHVSEDEALLGLPRPQSALASLVLGWAGGLVLLGGQLPLLRLYSYQLLHSNPATTAAFHTLFYLHTLLGELQPVLTRSPHYPRLCQECSRPSPVSGGRGTCSTPTGSPPSPSPASSAPW